MNFSGREERYRSLYKPPTALVLLALAFIFVGMLGLVVSFALAPRDSWIWLDVLFVIFGGIANGVLVWTAVFRTAQAKWTFAINRVAQSVVFYIPLLAIVLFVLLGGIPNFEPWVAHPDPKKAAWLSIPAMVIRDIVALGALWLMYFLIARWSLVADDKVRNGEEIARSDHFRLNALSTTTILTYSVSVSIVTFDYIMSLWPSWVSTMFAPYIFTTNAYIGMAVLVILCALLRRPLGVEKLIGCEQFHDMGNLMLGFSLLNMGFFFAQYLTIWYENLPEEAPFLIVRYLNGPWSYIGWASFIIAYALPFVLLQSRMIKMSAKAMTAVSSLAIFGFALERYVLVVPSLRLTHLMIFPVGVLGMFLFIGAFIIAVISFLSRYSPISAADEVLKEANQPESVS